MSQNLKMSSPDENIRQLMAITYSIRLGPPALKFRKAKDKPLTQDFGGGQKKLEEMILHQDRCLRPSKRVDGKSVGTSSDQRTRGVPVLRFQNAKRQTFG